VYFSNEVVWEGIDELLFDSGKGVAIKHSGSFQDLVPLPLVGALGISVRVPCESIAVSRSHATTVGVSGFG
jgi:hypothetical protein